jgi:hypothetical protein
LSVSEQNFTNLDGRADILRPFIWSISGLMQFRDGSEKGTADGHQKL